MEKKNSERQYSNGEITVIWKPDVCIHSKICWKKTSGLPEVFKPMEKPWIDMKGSETENIKNQVDKCPSGALSYIINREEKIEEKTDSTLVELSENGPLMVHGPVIIKNKESQEERKSKITAFCRCGHSNKKPFCDGSHSSAGFKG